ncbi:MAG TPA: RsmB/NOP family class I SAM-dependent RNA methyltransferase [Rhodothermales bacterium]|nr:RsmB/NOP family class I SAM-dependent RNA methyltransferase [Rhodothermales bacterium]
MTDARHTETQLPAEFLERLRAIVPSERYDDVLATFAAPQATSFRVNTLRAERAAVVQALEAEGLHLHVVDWKEDAFWVAPEERAALLASAAFKQQHIYVQNLSSMIPPLVLDAQPGERVLDLAAAPGSKTLQLACAMHDEGELAAVEVVKGRFFKLRNNLAAQGADNVRTFLQDGTRVWRYRPEYFDRVLLDAPCSTEGRFRADEPETFAYWSPRKIKEMARKQRRLLYSAVQCLRPGGVLVYSTCSFAPEENEAILNKTLRKFGDAIHLEPLGLDLDNLLPPLGEWKGKRFKLDLSHARRLLPTPTMEGFFIAKIRKEEGTAGK